MSDILLILSSALTFILMGLTMYYRRAASKAEAAEAVRRQKGKDSLELHDFTKSLDDIGANIKRLEKERLDARDAYSRRSWRPGSPTEPHDG